MNWLAFWEAKAAVGNDFQATGRGLMDVAGYLHTVSEAVRLLGLRQGEVLADIGCGVGLIALSLAPWLGQVHAVDISPALIKRARSNLDGLGNVRVEVGSLGAIPLASRSVDKLLAYSVVQYLDGEQSVREALKEVARVLRPGGRALLAANPDPMRRGAYESVVRQRGEEADSKREIALLDELLWIAGSRLKELAANEGLEARIEPISPRIWQHFYMFDLVLEVPAQGEKHGLDDEP